MFFRKLGMAEKKQAWEMTFFLLFCPKKVEDNFVVTWVKFCEAAMNEEVKFAFLESL